MTTFINYFTHRYSKAGLWSLFLICAFPLHLWTLILVFMDVSWVSERTNMWDAIGVGSYGLLFALVESIIIFIVFTLAGYLTPKQWTVDRRIAFLSMLMLLLALWAMIGQLLFLWNVSLPASVLQWLAQSGHPLRYLYALSLVIVIPSILIPVYQFIRSGKSVQFMLELIDRLSVLSVFYLLLDVVGIVIVIIRNIP